ncbi:Ku protein [Roseovarius sp. SCSIO 43702]|uniref:non-homologous end joining protein Ku n=1 Tax=Roseovarius sp. SCSIO 43702 TaxID=2823043 RepID=UPI001C72E498|nr:Ku protein [Roseovarius sp. SCSIO 43702]QYX56793.1 Ku protein [Roseovarius sp. SCSIO 43702]
MAPRALWKGQLRLSLVSIPVEIYSATKRGARVSFRQIHEPSGRKVRYEKTVPGVGPVKAEDIVKGYEIGDDEYLLIDPEEIDAIKLETKKTFELVQFVDACEIPPLYFDKPYYITAADDLAEDAYRVVRDALRKAGKVGLGQVTMRGKEYLAAVKPCGDGLLMETLRYEDELREADSVFTDIEDEEADPDLLEVATSLIERKSAPFDAGAYTDKYAEALHELLAAKRKDKKTPRARDESERGEDGGDNVVDLMSALKQSLKEAKASDKKKPRRKKAS